MNAVFIIHSGSTLCTLWWTVLGHTIKNIPALSVVMHIAETGRDSMKEMINCLLKTLILWWDAITFMVNFLKLYNVVYWHFKRLLPDLQDQDFGNLRWGEYLPWTPWWYMPLGFVWMLLMLCTLTTNLKEKSMLCLSYW